MPGSGRATNHFVWCWMVEMSYNGAMRRTVRFSLTLVMGLGLVRAWGAEPAPPAAPSPGAAAPTDGGVAASGRSEVEPDTNAAPLAPYQLIVDRNPFGLRTPPPQQPTNTTAPVAASALKLTGVTTLLGGKRAMFTLQEPGKTNLVSGLVREGDWDEVITNLQVLAIDERSGVVQVKYGGTELDLNFDDNGIKPPAGPMPGMPVPGLGRPGMPPVPGQPVPMAQPAPVGVSFNNSEGYRRVPNRPNRLTPGGVEAGAQPVLSPEQQLTAIQAQAELGRQQGVPMPPSPPGAGNAANQPLPPLPPTPTIVLPPTPGR